MLDDIQVAERLGISRKMVLEMTKKRVLPSPVIKNRKVYWKDNEIEEVITSKVSEWIKTNS